MLFKTVCNLIDEIEICDTEECLKNPLVKFNFDKGYGTLQSNGIIINDQKELSNYCDGKIKTFQSYSNTQTHSK